MDSSTLKWHVLSPFKLWEGYEIPGGMRSGYGEFRSDIYPEHDRPGFYVFYCEPGLGGDGYSRAVHFDTVWEAMHWAQEQYDEYLDPEQVDFDEDEYR